MEKEFKKLLKNANKAIMNLKSKEDYLAEFFKPYFDEEIHVLYQESDGFVILHNVDYHDRDHSNLNTGVIEAFKNIKADKNYYRKVEPIDDDGWLFN